MTTYYVGKAARKEEISCITGGGNVSNCYGKRCSSSCKSYQCTYSVTQQFHLEEYSKVQNDIRTKMLIRALIIMLNDWKHVYQQVTEEIGIKCRGKINDYVKSLRYNSKRVI